MAVALLNLSGLGLGYLLLGRLLPMVGCLVATGLTVVAALPVAPDGVPGVVPVLWLVVAVASAAHGAWRAMGESPSSARDRLIPFALPLAVVLFAVPVSAVLVHNSMQRAAQHEAYEQLQLSRLAEADRLVGRAEQGSFDDALKIYADLAENHVRSRAARRVPDGIKKLYETAALPYTSGEYCDAQPTLRYLRDLRTKVNPALLGDRAGWPDEPLAHSLHECGALRLEDDLNSKAGEGMTVTSAGLFNSLADEAPGSPYVDKTRKLLEDKVAELKKAAAGDPCGSRATLHNATAVFKEISAGYAGALADGTSEIAQEAHFGCGVREFKKKQFAAAQATMTGYVKRYKDGPQVARARQIAIAAEIARQTSKKAGSSLPRERPPGGARMAVTVRNDGKGKVEILYTGPVTGRIMLKSCGKCRVYPNEKAGNSRGCQGSRSYPRATLLLPKGKYHLLIKRDGRNDGDAWNIRPGYVYTSCLFVHKWSIFDDL
ncbi:hypothetical protein [Spongiactinospora sp. 9N601]|uniref:hypothetical protein n=1 Tax=Spongiactinospora sp. 9N601 TaxID=3375149 RepID=UPI00378AE94C